MKLATINDPAAGTDFYLEASASHPLLSAAEERAIDLKKWAAARRCLRLLLADPDARALLREFCVACTQSPPLVDNFEPRSLYFTLRKDIVDHLPGGTSTRQLADLARALDRADSNDAALLAHSADMNWPTTLMTGLAIIHLRRLGVPLPDLMADAMVIWQPCWSRRYRDRGGSLRAGRGRRMLHRSLNRYTAARDKLVMHNLRLVHKLAWNHPGKGIPQTDLVQEGIIGLIRAAEKYDFSRGFRFTTYAYPWINQHLQRASENRGSLITYPSHVVQEINQLHRLRRAHQEKTGHDPGVKLLAEQTGFDLDKVNQLRRLNNITVSVDHPEADDNDLRRAATVADPDSDQAAVTVENNSVRRLLWQHIDQLDEREQAVICGRWSLDGRPQRTFAQLAEQLQVSREWVRQLEQQAMAKLGAAAQLNQAFTETYA